MNNILDYREDVEEQMSLLYGITYNPEEQKEENDEIMKRFNDWLRRKGREALYSK